jgi:two-component system, OmpR family, alkaline phosphatase synthesis response regulator PhoP
LLRASIITDGKVQIERLNAELSDKGLFCSIDSDGKKTVHNVSARALDLVFVAIDGGSNNLQIMNLAKSIKRESHMPVIALLSKKALDRLDSGLAVDDFVVEPWDANEIAIRAKRVLGKTEEANQELIHCGDLTIDLARYEVYVNKRHLELTFKEYELLRFLARNKGRVFTREALLNEVWGYEYYGGDRTVDVHITRLRSKLEDPDHTFIETVRNIGYRFKENA